MKLLLICPECGNSEWIARDDADGAFECGSCGDLVLPEDMCARSSEEEPATSRFPVNDACRID